MLCNNADTCRKLFTLMSVILALAAKLRMLCILGLRYELLSDKVQNATTHEIELAWLETIVFMYLHRVCFGL